MRRTCEDTSSDGVTYFLRGESEEEGGKNNKSDKKKSSQPCLFAMLSRRNSNNESSRRASPGAFSVPSSSRNTVPGKTYRKKKCPPSLPRTHTHLQKIHNYMPRKHSQRCAGFPILAFRKTHIGLRSAGPPVARSHTQPHVKKQTNKHAFPSQPRLFFSKLQREARRR